MPKQYRVKGKFAKKPKNTKPMQSGSARPLGAKGKLTGVQNSEKTLVQTAPISVPSSSTICMGGEYYKVELPVYHGISDLKSTIDKLKSERLDCFLVGIFATLALELLVAYLVWRPEYTEIVRKWIGI